MTTFKEFIKHEISQSTFISMFEDAKNEMPSYLRMTTADNFSYTLNDIRVYINSDCNYFSWDIADKTFTLTYNKKSGREPGYNFEIYEGKDFLDDKIELLMVDALERAIQYMQETQNKERIKYDKLVDVLFGKMVKRRKAQQEKQKVANETNIKIVSKEIAKIYI